jgi:hypothetical protein
MSLFILLMNIRWYGMMAGCMVALVAVMMLLMLMSIGESNGVSALL